MRYELFYLVGVSKELELEEIKKKVDEIITSHSGEFEEKSTEEKRRMAYKIKKDTHGIYIAKRFTLKDKKYLAEINTKLNLYPGVLRFLISDASELPELRTKEERMEQEAKEKKEEAEKIKQEEAIEAKEEIKKASPEKIESKKEDAPVSEEEKIKDTEAIDKKLEEILNI